MIAMKYYTSTTQFNCGIDLHARQMYVCVMDRDGQKLVHTNIKNNDFAYFLKLVAPYRHDLTVCAECMFGWYWLADACADAGLHFVLAHALYLKAIHGGKNKNDRLDSEKIAHLLRTNLIPPGYVYPAAKRPLRALLRQRLASRFRNDLLDHGFLMIQFSVYARPCVNFEQLSKHLVIIQKMVPEAGNVRLLYITDEQWAKSVTVIGPNYDQGKRANNAKIPDQVEFWE